MTSFWASLFSSNEKQDDLTEALDFTIDPKPSDFSRTASGKAQGLAKALSRSLSRSLTSPTSNGSKSSQDLSDSEHGGTGKRRRSNFRSRDSAGLGSKSEDVRLPELASPVAPRRVLSDENFAVDSDEETRAEQEEMRRKIREHMLQQGFDVEDYDRLTLHSQRSRIKPDDGEEEDDNGGAESDDSYSQLANVTFGTLSKKQSKGTVNNVSRTLRKRNSLGAFGIPDDGLSGLETDDDDDDSGTQTESTDDEGNHVPLIIGHAPASVNAHESSPENETSSSPQPATFPSAKPESPKFEFEPEPEPEPKLEPEEPVAKPVFVSVRKHGHGSGKNVELPPATIERKTTPPVTTIASGTADLDGGQDDSPPSTETQSNEPEGKKRKAWAQLKTVFAASVFKKLGDTAKAKKPTTEPSPKAPEQSQKDYMRRSWAAFGVVSSDGDDESANPQSNGVTERQPRSSFVSSVGEKLRYSTATTASEWTVRSRSTISLRAFGLPSSASEDEDDVDSLSQRRVTSSPMVITRPIPSTSEQQQQPEKGTPVVNVSSPKPLFVTGGFADSASVSLEGSKDSFLMLGGSRESVVMGCSRESFGRPMSTSPHIGHRKWRLKSKLRPLTTRTAPLQIGVPLAAFGVVDDDSPLIPTEETKNPPVPARNYHPPAPIFNGDSPQLIMEDEGAGSCSVVPKQLKPTHFHDDVWAVSAAISDNSSGEFAPRPKTPLERNGMGSGELGEEGKGEGERERNGETGSGGIAMPLFMGGGEEDEDGDWASEADSEGEKENGAETGKKGAVGEEGEKEGGEEKEEGENEERKENHAPPEVSPVQEKSPEVMLLDSDEETRAEVERMKQRIRWHMCAAGFLTTQEAATGVNPNEAVKIKQTLAALAPRATIALRNLDEVMKTGGPLTSVSMTLQEQSATDVAKGKKEGEETKEGMEDEKKEGDEEWESGSSSGEEERDGEETGAKEVMEGNGDAEVEGRKEGDLIEGEGEEKEEGGEGLEEERDSSEDSDGDSGGEVHEGGNLGVHRGRRGSNMSGGNLSRNQSKESSITYHGDTDEDGVEISKGLGHGGEHRKKKGKRKYKHPGVTTVKRHQRRTSSGMVLSRLATKGSTGSQTSRKSSMGDMEFMPGEGLFGATLGRARGEESEEEDEVMRELKIMKWRIQRHMQQEGFTANEIKAIGNSGWKNNKLANKRTAALGSRPTKKVEVPPVVSTITPSIPDVSPHGQDDPHDADGEMDDEGEEDISKRRNSGGLLGVEEASVRRWSVQFVDAGRLPPIDGVSDTEQPLDHPSHLPYKAGLKRHATTATGGQSIRRKAKIQAARPAVKTHSLGTTRVEEISRSKPGSLGWMRTGAAPQRRASRVSQDSAVSGVSYASSLQSQSTTDTLDRIDRMPSRISTRSESTLGSGGRVFAPANPSVMGSVSVEFCSIRQDPTIEYSDEDIPLHPRAGKTTLPSQFDYRPNRDKKVTVKGILNAGKDKLPLPRKFGGSKDDDDYNFTTPEPHGTLGRFRKSVRGPMKNMFHKK